jgi:hypothetical protein
MTCEDVRRALIGLEEGSARLTGRDELEVHVFTCSSCRDWRASDERFETLLSRVGDDEPPEDFTKRVMADVRNLARDRELEVRREPSGTRLPVGRRLLALHGALAAAALLVAAAIGGITSVDGILPRVPSIEMAPPVALSVPTIDALTGPAISSVATGGNSSNLALAGACVVALIILNAAFARGVKLGPSVRLIALVAFGAFWISAGTSMASAFQETSTQSPPPEFFQSVRETSDAVRILLLVLMSLGVGTGISAVAILFRTYAPTATAKVDHVVRERSGLYQLFIGSCDAVLLFVLVVATARIEPLKLISLLLIGVVFFLVALGFAARARAVGRDVLALGGAVRPELAQTLVGSVVLVAILLVPILGQLFWIALLAQCLGTAFLGLLRRGIRGRVSRSDQ